MSRFAKNNRAMGEKSSLRTFVQVPLQTAAWPSRGIAPFGSGLRTRHALLRRRRSAGVPGGNADRGATDGVRGRLQRHPGCNAREWPSPLLRQNVHKPPRRSRFRRDLTKQRAIQAADGPATPTDRGHTCPRPINPQRAPAGVHELPGRPLPGRVARDGPPLDRRRPHRLLPHPRRPAPLLARPAGRLRHLDDATDRRRAPRPPRRASVA